jgi:hypothetical protein
MGMTRGLPVATTGYSAVWGQTRLR